MTKLTIESPVKDFHYSTVKGKIHFTNLQPITNDMKPIKLVFYTPINRSHGTSEEWETVADFTKVKSGGVSPEAILKLL